MRAVRRPFLFSLWAVLLACGPKERPDLPDPPGDRQFDRLGAQGNDAGMRESAREGSALSDRQQDASESDPALSPGSSAETTVPDTGHEASEQQAQDAGAEVGGRNVSIGVEDAAVDELDRERAGWKLHWADEFDGRELDTEVWTPYHNTYGDGNNELPCLTPGNVSLKDGALHVVARRESVACPNGAQRDFTSGFIGTREKGVYFPRFARYEMRGKVPHMHALWPAFWLRHRDGSQWAEVDVMEYFHMQVPGRTSATFHYDQTSNVAKGSAHFEASTTRPSGWHVWAAEIETRGDRVCLSFFVDEQRMTFNGMAAGEPHCFVDTGPFARHPGEGLFDIAINMAVGGNWVGHPDGPLDTLTNGRKVDPQNVQPTTFPAEYVVDYVRVYVR